MKVTIRQFSPFTQTTVEFEGEPWKVQQDMQSAFGDQVAEEHFKRLSLFQPPAEEDLTIVIEGKSAPLRRPS